MSPLQHKIYTYIRDHLFKHGHSPSLTEIAEGVGVNPYSKSLISKYVHILIKSGWLKSDHRGYRNISLPFSRSRLHFPIIGRISAGSPIEPVDKQEILDVAAALSEAGCYALEVKGDSMSGEGILDGDNIICKWSTSAKEGEIVVALIDEKKATLKKIHYKKNGTIVLKSANPSFKSQTYSKNRVTIQGIFVGLVRLSKKKGKKK